MPYCYGGAKPLAKRLTHLRSERDFRDKHQHATPHAQTFSRCTQVDFRLAAARDAMETGML